MKEKIKRLRFNFVVAALLYIALGVVLLVWPDTTSNLICYAAGTLLLIYGIIGILAFLIGKERTITLTLQMIAGVVAAGLGVFFLTQPRLILSVLPVLMGLFIIVVSILSIRRAVELRRYSYDRWWVAGLLALISIGIGPMIIFHPGMALDAVIMLIGVVFIYVGVCDLWAIWKVSRIMKQSGTSL